MTNTKETTDFKDNQKKIKRLYTLIKNSRERSQQIPALKNSFDGLFDEIKKMGVRETPSGDVCFRKMSQENYTVNRLACQRSITCGAYANVSRQISAEYTQIMTLDELETSND